MALPAIWLMDGINFVSTSAAGSFNPGPSWQVKGSGDFNGDGKSDILWQGSDGTPAIWLMDGATAVSVSAAGMASNQKLGFGSGTDADFSDPRGRPSWGDPPGVREQEGCSRTAQGWRDPRRGERGDRRRA
jgi:hypothetical protein